MNFRQVEYNNKIYKHSWSPFPAIIDPLRGLELRYDHRGRLFYVDHVTRTTSWYRPSLDQEAGLARLNQRSALGALQVTTFPGLERYIVFFFSTLFLSFPKQSDCRSSRH
jgi:hypothetical protein